MDLGNNTATATLAESLLDDLDDLSDAEEEEEDIVKEEEVHGYKFDDDDTMNNNDNGREDAHNRYKTDDHDVSSPSDAKMEDESGDIHMTKMDNNSNSNSNKNKNDSNNQIPGPDRKRLLLDKGLKAHLDHISKLSSTMNHNDKNSSNSTTTTTTTTKEQVLTLLHKCNKYLTQLQDEMYHSHLDLASAYAPQFPELLELLPDPIGYRKTVQVLLEHSSSHKNHNHENNANNKHDDDDDDSSNLNLQLSRRAHLGNGQIVALSIAHASSTGRKLATHEINIVQERIQYFDQVLNAIHTLTSWVETKIVHMSPNACAFLNSPALVSRMIGAAGGLDEWSRIPACNLQVLGRVKHTASSRGGLGRSANVVITGTNNNSTTTTTGTHTENGNHSNAGGDVSSTIATITTQQRLPHEGILADCDLVKSVISINRRKALKVVASKLALCVRCDAAYAKRHGGGLEASSSSSSSNLNHNNHLHNAKIGMQYRAEVEEKFQKLEEPDKAPVVKALPKPDLTTKKRRGGKRIRRLKERFEETELMKQANRRGFSTESGEYGDDAMGLTLGMLESSTDIRKGVGERKKMRHANTKASRKRAAQELKYQQSSGNHNNNQDGLASSMVFTPVQGLELVNPDARNDRVKEANRRWFQEHAGFQSALPKDS